MTTFATWRRAAANLLAVGATALLFSACMLTSETNLVAPTETVEPIAGGFSMVSYNEETGVLTKSAEAPADFSFKDGGYASSDGALTAYFVPTDVADTYLVAIGSTDGAIYAVARYRGDIMEINLIFGEDPAGQLANAGVTVPAGATIAEGGIVVADRAALDAVIALVIEGKLALSPLVAWVGSGEAPATLKREGDWYVAG